MMRAVKITVSILIFFTVVWNLTVIYVDTKLSQRTYPDVYDNCNKIWSSRGLYNSYKERNSITSFRRAFKHGAVGGEVDFSYDAKLDRFIVGHGHPKKDANGNYIYAKKDGIILTLEKLFDAVGDEHYFWLDYKNLEHLSAKETKAAIARLKKITSQGDLREKLYIEASNPLALPAYTRAGFKTILGIHPLPEDDLLASLVVNGYKIAYYFNDITVIAMPYGSLERPVYGHNTAEALLSIPRFIFHIPDDKVLLHHLLADKEVRVLLVGRDKSIDRFVENNCHDNISKILKN
jgi:hypothetical protein